MGVASSAGWRVGADHPACLAQLARQQGLQSQREWYQLCKSREFPTSLPKDPYKKYKGKGWISWVDWLGTARRARQVGCGPPPLKCNCHFGALTSRMKGLWHSLGMIWLPWTAPPSQGHVSEKHCEARHNPLHARGSVPSLELQILVIVRANLMQPPTRAGPRSRSRRCATWWRRTPRRRGGTTGRACSPRARGCSTPSAPRTTSR